jgi:hypothetical protein
MNTSFGAALAAWHDFYALLGSGAATLIGLMFVAVTFGASLIEVATESTTRAFLDPTVTHFVQVLVTACLVLTPTIEPLPFGVLLAAIGVLRTIALIGVHRSMRSAHRENGDVELSDWMSGVIVPFAVYAGFIGCGVAFSLGHTAFGALAIATVAALLNGIYGAWELMLWLALRRSRSPRQ